MAFSEILQMITNHGLTAVLVGYFLLKDYKFNGQIIGLLTECKEVLAVLKGYMK